MNERKCSFPCPRKKDSQDPLSKYSRYAKGNITAKLVTGYRFSLCYELMSSIMCRFLFFIICHLEYSSDVKYAKYLTEMPKHDVFYNLNVDNMVKVKVKHV